MHPLSFPRAGAGALFALALAVLPASPALAADTPQEAANKKVVLDFYAALDKAEADKATAQRIEAIAEQYIAVDYVQHSEGVPSGRAGFIQLMKGGGGRPIPPGQPGGPPPMQPAKLELIMAEGDRVIQITSRGPSMMIWNMFRVKDGKLTDHWVPAR